MSRQDLKKKAKGLLEQYKWFTLPAGILVFVLTAISGYLYFRQLQDLQLAIQLQNTLAQDGYTVRYHVNTMQSYIGLAISVLSILSLLVLRYRVANWKELFKLISFKKIGRLFLVSILMTIKVVLWTLLFIIPGIIKTYEYALVIPYVASDDDITFKEAFRKSKENMRGYKFELFVLGLSFIGWFILAYFTAGLLFIWLIPYYLFTLNLFYLNRMNALEAEEASV